MAEQPARVLFVCLGNVPDPCQLLKERGVFGCGC